MITPSHSLRKVLGRRSKISCAIASISARVGAFVWGSMASSLKHDPEKWEPVFGKDHAQTKRWSEMTIRRSVISRSFAQVHAGFGRGQRLTLGGQSETLRSAQMR